VDAQAPPMNPKETGLLGRRTLYSRGSKYQMLTLDCNLKAFSFYTNVADGVSYCLFAGNIYKAS